MIQQLMDDQPAYAMDVSDVLSGLDNGVGNNTATTPDH
jgi:hypothetical protein